MPLSKALNPPSAERVLTSSLLKDPTRERRARPQDEELEDEGCFCGTCVRTEQNVPVKCVQLLRLPFSELLIDVSALC